MTTLLSFLSPIDLSLGFMYHQLMPVPNIFSKSHLAFMRQMYMRMMVQPAELTDLLNKKYATSYSVAQVSRAINSRGWSARRKEVIKKAGSIEAVSDVRIARQIGNAHAQILSEFADRSVKGARKALDFIDQADNPRTLQAAAAAAKSLFSMFKLSAGIENPSNTNAAATFNFNFANTPIKMVAPTLEVQNSAEDVNKLV